LFGGILKSIMQVEFSPSLLEERESVLRQSGCRVISVLGCGEVQGLTLAALNIGVIVIGHGAPWCERQELVTQFRKEKPAVVIVSLLRSTDEPFSEADFNIPADNPPLWERTVLQALTGLQ
jgi:hypothetical protein